jgi:hypothetical protein
MGFRLGRKLVPSSTIRDRMDRKDLRFQADARREAVRLALLYPSRSDDCVRPTQTYALSDGRRDHDPSVVHKARGGKSQL